MSVPIELFEWGNSTFSTSGSITSITSALLARAPAGKSPPIIIAQAAIAGLGAALLPRFLIQSELDRGELAIIVDRPLQNNAGYYLVIPEENPEYAPVAALRKWLLKTVAMQ